MLIAVCVKQVPNTDNIEYDSEHNTLRRESAGAIMNPYDSYALETALRLKGKYEGSVTVITMGPPSAEKMLRKCIAVGADEVILLTDNDFSGADTLATGKTLAAAIRKAEQVNGIPFDIILCGKQTLDGDTGQTSPILAELLERPLMYGIRSLEFVDGKLQAERMYAGVQQTVISTLPSIVSVSSTPYTLRIETLKGRLASAHTGIGIWDRKALDIDAVECGHAGSPTQVIRTYIPSHDRECVLYFADNEGDIAEAFAGAIKTCGITAIGE